MEDVKIKAEHLTTFDNFQQWVNKASSRIGGFRKTETIICVDRNGCSCNIGSDFKYADDNNLFPVKAYRLIRTYEQKEK